MNPGRPNLRHRLPRGGNLCDFCGATEVHQLYGCSNFVFLDEKVFDRPTAWWAACSMCSGLIDHSQISTLTDRVMESVSKRQGVTAEELDALHWSLSKLHKGFQSHRLKTTVLKVFKPALA